MERQDLLGLARLALQIACKQPPDYGSTFAPKRSTQPSLLAGLCLKAFLHMDARRCEALLGSAPALRGALGLHAVPDHSTLWWFNRHQVKPRLLARALSETVYWQQVKQTLLRGMIYNLHVTGEGEKEYLRNVVSSNPDQSVSSF